MELFLKVSFMRFCAKGRLRFAVSRRKDGKVKAPKHFKGISLYERGTVKKYQELEY